MFKNLIKLNYISYYKINENQKINYIFFYLYILKKYNKMIFTCFNLPAKKKYFCLIKSPKCYKTGKLLIKYKYFKFFFLLILKKKILKLNNCLSYFLYIKKKYIVYQTIFSKNTKLTVNLHIEYNLKIFYDSTFHIFIHYI